MISASRRIYSIRSRKIWSAAYSVPTGIPEDKIMEMMAVRDMANCGRSPGTRICDSCFRRNEEFDPSGIPCQVRARAGGTGPGEGTRRYTGTCWLGGSASQCANLRGQLEVRTEERDSGTSGSGTNESLVGRPGEFISACMLRRPSTVDLVSPMRCQQSIFDRYESIIDPAEPEVPSIRNTGRNYCDSSINPPSHYHDRTFSSRIDGRNLTIICATTC